jgi:hypothetical protein
MVEDIIYEPASGVLAVGSLNHGYVFSNRERIEYNYSTRKTRINPG